MMDPLDRLCDLAGSHAVITQMIGKFAAREIEWVAALGRQFGYRFPADYDIGVAVTLPPRVGRAGDIPVKVRIRLDDQVRAFFIDMGPDSTASDHEWPTVLAREASCLVHQWLDARPHLAPSVDQQRAFLERPRDDAALAQRVDAMVKAARFEVRR